MATKPKAKDITTLVTEGAALKRDIETKREQLKAIEIQLIERGSGTYEGSDGAQCTVIVPNPGIKPTEKDMAQAEAIAGDSFGKLFDKVTSYKPVKAFREVAAAVLTAARCSKLIALVEKAGSPFVKWPK